MKRILKSLVGTASAVMVMTGVTASAMTFGFVNVTDNGPTDVASQLSVTVTDAGAGQVLFTFNNSGPYSATISEIYFDDGTLLGIASIQNGAGVSFEQGASPKNLPGANNVDPTFSANEDFSSEASGNNSTGVDNGETLGILFNLVAGKVYSDTLAALGDGSLRIGLHVRSIDGGNSDSFVNGGRDVPPGNQVPDAAATVMLLGMALLGVEGFRRRLAR